MSINIKVRDNGPYVIEGDFTITDAQGNPVPVVKKALCRCGGSVTKPFCDGTHSKIGFQGAMAAVESTSEPKPSGSSST